MSDITRPTTPVDQTPLLFSKFAQLSPGIMSRLFAPITKQFIDFLNGLTFDSAFLNSLNPKQKKGALNALQKLKIEINKYFNAQYYLLNRQVMDDRNVVTEPFPTLSSTAMYELLCHVQIKGISHKTKAEDMLNIIEKILYKLSKIFQRNSFHINTNKIPCLSMSDVNYFNFKRAKNYFKTIKNDLQLILTCQVPSTPPKSREVTQMAHEPIISPLARHELIEKFDAAGKLCLDCL